MSTIFEQALKADNKSGNSILRAKLDSGLDENLIFYMEDIYMFESDFAKIEYIFPTEISVKIIKILLTKI